jgi:hypothetical protein
MSKTPLKPKINPKTDFSLNCSKPENTSQKYNDRRSSSKNRSEAAIDVFLCNGCHSVSDDNH